MSNTITKGQINARLSGQRHSDARHEGLTACVTRRQLRVRFGGSKQGDRVGIAVHGFGDRGKLALISWRGSYGVRVDGAVTAG